MGVFWGLLAAIFIGASDCIARVTSQRVPSCFLIGSIMGLSTLALLVWLFFTGDWPAWQPYAWTASALSGGLNLLVLFLLYKALARGPVSVASPVASIFTILLVMLNVVSGEPWSWSQMLAVLIVFAGVIMLTRRSEPDGVDREYSAQWLRVTAGYAFATACAVAIRMFLAQEVSDQIGPIEALFLNRLFALLGCMIWVFVWLKKNAAWRPKNDSITWLVVAQGVLETLAFSVFLLGSVNGGRIAAAIGFSAFAAATTFFAWVWLKEAVGLRRVVWMAVIAMGIVLAVLGKPA